LPENTIFFNEKLCIGGVSIPVDNQAIELVEVGTVMGIVRIEVVLNELVFKNLWLSLEDHKTLM
jgi:hypothetical protein